jgi:hypothetical protein
MYLHAMSACANLLRGPSATKQAPNNHFLDSCIIHHALHNSLGSDVKNQPHVLIIKAHIIGQVILFLQYSQITLYYHQSKIQ